MGPLSWGTVLCTCHLNISITTNNIIVINCYSPFPDSTKCIPIPACDSEQQIELIIPLLKPTECRPEFHPISQHLNTSHFPKKGDKRRDCVVCSDRKEGGKRRLVYHTCDKCPDKPALCVEPCFKKYHLDRPSLYHC